MLQLDTVIIFYFCSNLGKQLTEQETEHLASLCGCIFVRHEVRSRHFLNQPQYVIELIY